MSVGAPLFARGSLSDYLRKRKADLRGHVERYVALHPHSSEEATTLAIVESSTVMPLSISFDQAQKDAKPARVSIKDFGRTMEIDGVRVTKSYPYAGSSELFDLRPSTYTMVIPYGRVTAGVIVIGVEGPKDATQIKGALDRYEQLLKQYTEWQRSEVESHNASLAPHVTKLVEDHLEYLQGVEDLKDLI